MHRRAARRRRTHGDSGHSWVAGGGSGGGGAADARRAGCRAGHRSALDLFGPGPPAFCHSLSAEGRTVGGSADGAGIFTGSPCRACPGAEGCNGTGGADHEQSSSSGSAKELRKFSRFCPRTGLTANVEQIVDIPARGGLQGFLPGQGSSSRRFL